MIFVNSASAGDLTPNLGILLAYHNQILLVGYLNNVANESEGGSFQCIEWSPKYLLASNLEFEFIIYCTTKGTAIVLSIVHLWSALRWQPWIGEAVVTLRTHKEQHHPGFLPFRLVLIKHCTEYMSVESLDEMMNRMCILFVTAPWTCDIRVRLRLSITTSLQIKSVEVLTSVGSEPKSVVTPTCSLQHLSAFANSQG